VPGCASLTPPGRFAPGNQDAGHELWVGGGAVPGVTGAVNLKKWHQPPGRPDALLDAIGQLADAGGFRGSSHRLDVPGLCTACR